MLIGVNEWEISIGGTFHRKIGGLTRKGGRVEDGKIVDRVLLAGMLPSWVVYDVVPLDKM